MRGFMNQRGEFLRLRLTGQEGDSAAVADAKRGSNPLVEFERDVLRVQKGNQPFPVCADFAADLVLNLGKLGTFGLRNVEHVDGAEANQHRRGFRIVARRVFLFRCVFPAPRCDHRARESEFPFRLS